LDASQPKGAVLDCFAGSGSTLVAAAKTRRIGYGVELDPIYCDVILTRLTRVLKVDPVLQQTGKTFTEMAAERSDATAPGNHYDTLPAYKIFPRSNILEAILAR